MDRYQSMIARSRVAYHRSHWWSCLIMAVDYLGGGDCREVSQCLVFAKIDQPEQQIVWC